MQTLGHELEEAMPTAPPDQRKPAQLREAPRTGLQSLLGCDAPMHTWSDLSQNKWYEWPNVPDQADQADQPEQPANAPRHRSALHGQPKPEPLQPDFLLANSDPPQPAYSERTPVVQSQLVSTICFITAQPEKTEPFQTTWDLPVPSRSYAATEFYKHYNLNQVQLKCEPKLCAILDYFILYEFLIEHKSFDISLF
jgi:hypothetical protein